MGCGLGCGDGWMDGRTPPLHKNDQTPPLTRTPARNNTSHTHTQTNNTQAIKAWRVYQLTEEALTTMGTVLPLVDDLHSPAMRGR
jgi:hypothetical protein